MSTVVKRYVKRALLLAPVLICGTGCAGQFVRTTSATAETFTYEPSNLSTHLVAAVALLIFGVLLPVFLRERKILQRGIYFFALFMFLILSMANLYGYFVKRDFSLELKQFGMRVTDIHGTTEIPWAELRELRQTQVIPWLPSKPRFIRQGFLRMRMMDAQGKTLGFVPLAFARKDLDWFVRVMLAHDIAISAEMPPVVMTGG